MEKQKTDRAKSIELAANLRELADVVERNGGRGLPFPGTIFVQIDVSVAKPGMNVWQDDGVDEDATKKAMQAAIRGMGRGKKEKVYNDFAFVVNKKIGEHVVLQVKTGRGATERLSRGTDHRPVVRREHVLA